MTLRQIARIGLTVVLICSLAWSAWQVRAFIATTGGEMFVTRGADELGAAYDRALARHATPQRIAARLTDRLDEEPRNWIAIRGLADLAETRQIALPQPLVARLATLDELDNDLIAQSAACARCAWDPAQCDLGFALVCGIGVQITPAGDVASLARAGVASTRGAEVDRIDVALSAVGLGAVVLAPATGGTSVAVKAGAGLLKVAHRAGHLSAGLTGVLRRAAADGIAWSRLGDVRGIDGLGTVLRTEALRPAADTATAAAALTRRTSAATALHFLSRADSATEAKRFAQAANVLGERTTGTLEVLGKRRFLRVGLRLADELHGAFAAILAAVVAAMALAWSTLANACLRLLRRLAARRAADEAEN